MKPDSCSSEKDKADKENSYSDVMRSSAIIGSSRLVTYGIQLIGMKIVALVLGRAGLGLIGLYQSAQLLVTTASGFGINDSGVRDVAKAKAEDDVKRIAATAAVLRRACWGTGIFGLLLATVAASPLSWWLFESDSEREAISLLGLAVLLTAVSAGQLAVLQGLRRIKELAKINIFSALAGMLASSALYIVLGTGGILPAIVLTSAINLYFSWSMVRKIPLEPVSIGWCETWGRSKGLLSLGFTFMWAALLGGTVTLFLKGSTNRELGIDAAGIYQAAWGLSGLFANFLLSALATDFFPRLTGVVEVSPKVNRMVNEQTEVGLMLALPGMVGTIAFAPLVLLLFYSAKFTEGAPLLVLFSLGVFVRIVGWPIGMIQRAKGAVGWLVVSQTSGHLMNLGMSLLFLRMFGLSGLGLGFLVSQLFQLVVAFAIAARLSGFRWSGEVHKLLLICVFLVLLSVATFYYLPMLLAALVGGCLFAVSSSVSLRGLSTRLGHNHIINRVIRRYSFLSALCRPPRASYDQPS